MMRLVAILAALMLPVPALAQAPAAPVAAPDPARVAVARKLLDQTMPPASRAQMIQTMTNGMSKSMPASVSESPEISAMLSKAPGGKAVFERFMQQQIDIGTQDLIANLPGMLDAMANAYARRFTVPQMTDIGAFFATPTGQAYLKEAPTLMADPDVSAWMSALMRRSMERMPKQLDALKTELIALEKKQKRGS